MGYEEKSKIHSDLGFPEMSESLETSILFDLTKDRFWFDGSSPQSFKILRPCQSLKGFFFLKHAAEATAYFLVFVLFKCALAHKWASIAMVACHMCNLCYPPARVLSEFLS